MSQSAEREGDLRRAILDTARNLLVVEGYERLTMRRIARRIGYSATAIYLHFESRDALVHTLIDEGMEALFQRLTEALSTAGRSGVDRLTAICRSYIAYGLENPEYYQIMYLLRTDRMARYPAEKYRRARRNLELIRDVLTDRTAFSVSAPAVGASTVWAALHGGVSLLISRRLDVRISQEALTESLVSQVVRGVASPDALPTLAR